MGGKDLRIDHVFAVIAVSLHICRAALLPLITVCSYA
jgi:hypothetical protein